MRAPAVSFVHKLLLVIAVGLLACDLALPQALAFAEGEDAPSALLASSLMDGSASVVREDVALAAPEDDAAPEPVIGSFTVDGLTFAVMEGSNVQLVGVAAVEADASAVALPESVTYGGAEYSVTSIGAYAFYLSGVTAVELPASVADVDDRAFRSSDVASVEVAEGNSVYSSFDGALYDADYSSLLLIPEGKQGTVLLPKTAESAAPSVFSHCPLVTQIAVEEGSAAFASENGLLHDASLTTLLRVPAGATDITIREGCTTIAAGAMEACASLATINAPASVTSISPYVFEQQPETIMAPVAVAAVENEVEGGSVDEDGSAEATPQLAGTLALTVISDSASRVDPESIVVVLPNYESHASWSRLGVLMESGSDGPAEPAMTSLISAEPYAVSTGTQYIDGNGGQIRYVYAATGVVGTDWCAQLGWDISSADYRWCVSGNKLTCPYAEYDYPEVSARRTGYTQNGWGGTTTGSKVADNTRIASWPSPLYALWTPNTYTVSFNAVGGTGGQSAAVRVTYDAAMPAISTTKPIRAGYTFGGWYDTSASTGGTQYYTASGVSAHAWDKATDATLYARWTANTITLTWNSNGGSSIANTSAAYSPSMKVPMPASNPTRAGYTFKGWFTSTTSTTQVTSSTALPTTNTTYYAQWTANTITLTWNSNGGSSIGNTSATYSGSTKVPMPSSSPTRAGYTFKGWFTATSGGTQVTSSTALPTSNTTYYAQWSANTITLTWNSNGGSSIGNTSKAYASGATVPMPSSNPTRAGYTFKGWFTSTTSATKVTSSTALPTTNTTYYAQWTANTITLTWNSQGGSSVANTSKVYAAGATVPMPSSNPTKAGYAFAGWYTAASGGTQITSSTALPTANTTYHAHWNANTITLTWNSQGGSSIGNTSKVYAAGAKVPMPSSNPTRAGYTFKGWFTAASGGTQVTSNTALPTANTTYHAQWTANTITLTWNSQGGSSIGSTSATYSGSAKVPMPASNPTRAGYTFAGWWTAATGGVQVTSSTALPTANTTYHAHWSLNPYSIAYELDGGSVSGNPTTYDVTTTTFTLKNPTRTGYAFAGWSGTGLSGDANKTVTIPQGSTGDRSYTAHWLPAISADIPLEVTAQVDLLGIEEQQEAAGYIESRCGEPLDVADVAFTPLSGATDLFGAANVADVALEVLAAGSTAPDARFSLDASASQAPATPAAFRMASYGTRVPIAYRFAIPEDVLASIDPARFEQVTTPVCSVSYTVVLA